MIVSLNIPDEVLKNINSFSSKHGFSNNTVTILELIRIGLLADKFIEETNLLPNIIQPIQTQIDIKPYLPKSSLETQRFLAKIPNSFSTQINSFQIANQIPNRSLAISILIRYALDKYKTLGKEKNDFKLNPSLLTEKRAIVSSKDEEIFSLLKKFQDEIACTKRTVAVCFLLQLAFDELEKLESDII
ncbi:MAG: hypothetical protein KH355_02280 [Clostridiales bacterium]|nr:hypothetical protein [Clostridiales bacterium]